VHMCTVSAWRHGSRDRRGPSRVVVKHRLFRQSAYPVEQVLDSLTAACKVEGARAGVAAQQVATAAADRALVVVDAAAAGVAVIICKHTCSYA
jgi:hypothetical protein